MKTENQKEIETKLELLDHQADAAVAAKQNEIKAAKNIERNLTSGGHRVHQDSKIKEVRDRLRTINNAIIQLREQLYKIECDFTKSRNQILANKGADK